MNPKVTSIIKTCNGCPTQWEGHVEDGRMFYFRYRGGICTLKMSKVPTDDVLNAMDVELHFENRDNKWDGIMDDEEVFEIIGRYFELPDDPSGPYAMGPGN